MSNILICYFSGTGNTKKVVKEFAKNMQNFGATVTLHNIEDGEIKQDLNNFDHIGIAYPIHAFNAPEIVLDFAKTLKKCKFKSKKPLFIIKTSGEPLVLNNISSTKLRSILKKNFVLTNEYHYCMPYNIIFRHTNNMAYKMWNTAQNVIPIDCQEILQDKIDKLSYFPCRHFLSWAFRIEHWGGKFNGKHYKVNESCVKCTACAKRCPTHNITIENGEFKFGKNCIMCMRCSFCCPTNAIKIGFFNKWKVNGQYNFDAFNESETQTHKKYCKKAYKKYFKKMETKISQNMQK